MNYSRHKNKQLGMNFGTASNILRKSILFNLLQKLNLNICHRCNSAITSTDSLSIDHKLPWMYSDRPKQLFFDLNNIAFSHKSCNSAVSRTSHVISNKTGFKGVVKRKDRFKSNIYVNGKTISLGSFDTAEDAAKAFDEAAILYHKDRAVTNKSLGLI